jgi:hypothetical protein
MDGEKIMCTMYILMRRSLNLSAHVVALSSEVFYADMCYMCSLTRKSRRFLHSTSLTDGEKMLKENIILSVAHMAAWKILLLQNVLISCAMLSSQLQR